MGLALNMAYLLVVVGTIKGYIGRVQVQEIKKYQDQDLPPWYGQFFEW